MTSFSAKSPSTVSEVADARAPREGRPVDTIGQYDATKQPAIVNVDEEKLLWLLKLKVLSLLTLFALCSKTRRYAKFADAKK